MQAEQSVVHVLKGGPADVEPVDLQSVAADVFQQGLDEHARQLPVVEGRVDEVHAQPSHRVLLEGIGRVE